MNFNNPWENQENVPQEPVHRRRRKRSKLQIFKETYLPMIIAGLTVVFLLVVIVGSISRTVSVHKAEKERADAEIKATQELLKKQAKEVEDLIRNADEMAAMYNFDAAIDAIDNFKGDFSKFPQLREKREAYTKAKDTMVAWDDPSKIPHLSFQLLIADTTRAFADKEYGEAYNRNYVTTDEFSKILQQLYDNDYMLVSLRDIVKAEVSEDGKTTYSAGTLYMPENKKPLVLSQCAVNYFTYMTDGDGDGFPDKGGDGFAYRLLQDENGKFVNKMIDAEGNDVTGAFDFVPILEEFIEQHPDFSYRGARAILAVTGYDGVFGYRTDSETQKLSTEENPPKGYSPEYYENELLGAQTLVQALKDAGYDIGCYTYALFGYGDEEASSIEKDLELWKQEVTPVLGDVDILIYPFGSDIAEYHKDAYDGDRYDVLHDAGFRYFIGMDSSTKSWADVNSDYFRMTRRLVTGAHMAYSPEVFEDLFDASTVLNTARGKVPES